MKKIICLFFASIAMLSLCSCGSDVSREQYEALMAENKEMKSEISAKEDELNKAQSELNNAETEYNDLNSKYSLLEKDYEKMKQEYLEYQTRMKPYEELDQAEAEARKIEAEAVKKKEEEEKARKAEEERKAAEEKEKTGYNTGITYDQLARNPEDYKGEKVKFYGKVVQVIEGDEEIQIRLAVNDDYDTILYCGYDSSIVSSRILKNDYITIYGVSVGVISYESTMGGMITIPGVAVDKIDQ